MPALRHGAGLLPFRERELVALDGHVRCANAEVARCNWLVDAPGLLCGSCALTRTRPADADVDALAAFADAEAAKRRLVYQLDDLGLPTDGVAFDLLSSAEEPVTTGHADGVVTIDLAEGDDAHREALRVQLAEPYGAGSGAVRLGQLHAQGLAVRVVALGQVDRDDAVGGPGGDRLLRRRQQVNARPSVGRPRS